MKIPVSLFIAVGLLLTFFVCFSYIAFSVYFEFRHAIKDPSEITGITGAPVSSDIWPIVGICIFALIILLLVIFFGKDSDVEDSDEEDGDVI